jgi:hypothetical protein
MSYRATATAVGNSKGLRVEGALFREHPEFANGEFEVDVIAPGRLLVRAQVADASGVGDDPILGAFLAFLGNEMANRPDLMVPMTATDAQRAAELVAGVEVSDDETFPDDFELP